MLMSRYIILILMLLWLTNCQTTTPVPFECHDVLGCVTIAPGKPIKLGVLQALSGGATPIGTTKIRTIELALGERPQLLGHPIELQIEDEHCTLEGGANAALRIIANPQIVAIIGTTCSGAAISASKIMSEAGLVMISGTNSAPSLTGIGQQPGTDWYPGYFRACYNGAVTSKAAANFVFKHLGLRRVATINDGDAFSRGFTDVFAETFTNLGGQIVLASSVAKGDEDMRPLLTAIVLRQAEAIFLPLFHPEGSFLVQQAQEVDGLDNIALVTADALRVDSFFDMVDQDGIGVYFVGPKPIANDSLATRYESQYDELPQHNTYAYTYDATMMLLHAIETVALQEPDQTLHIGRQALRDALYGMKNYPGVTGDLSCNQFGDCGVAQFEVVQVINPEAGIEGLKSNIVYHYQQRP